MQRPRSSLVTLLFVVSCLLAFAGCAEGERRLSMLDGDAGATTTEESTEPLPNIDDKPKP